VSILEDLYKYTSYELRNKILSKEISSEDIVKSIYKRINETEEHIKAYLYIKPEEELLREARDFDEKLASGEKGGLLGGIPVAVKDNICVKGIANTCGSKILENFVPPYDATVVRKLKKEGAIIIGKLNCDEFAMGSSNENSGYYPVKNPWDIKRVPGGSSGGSAASVSSDEAVISLGSDTGGSIRLPASFCGVAGMKPTYGRVSRFGLVAFGSSLDQIGPLAKDVKDTAIMLQAISGYDPQDSTSVNIDVPDYVSFIDKDPKGLKVGIPVELTGDGLEKGVRERFNEAVKVFEKLGVICEEISLPTVSYALPVYYIISSAEASANLARYDGVRYGFRDFKSEDVFSMYENTRSKGFGSEVKRRIMLGTYALSAGYYDAYYLKAQKVRTLLKRDFDNAFKTFDAIISPVAPTTAFLIGEKTDDPLQMYLTDICTIPINLTGVPSISIPSGLSDGLPAGLQITGKIFDETTVLRLARAFEQASGYHMMKPACNFSEVKQ
jgi:aspartyl-tRNA(Asn)/glutamyl-tRNA(Gln) amidotransferase subunit A